MSGLTINNNVGGHGFLGVFFTLIVAAAYPFVNVGAYGVEGLWFASTDAIIVSVLMRLVGMVFGIPL